MIAALLIVTAAALRWLHASGSAIGATGKSTNLVCRSDETPIDVEADYHVWRTVRVRAAISSFTQPCVVNVTLATVPSARRHPIGVSQLLLLVRIERLLLNERGDSFYVMMSNPIRRTRPYCSTKYCGAMYLWASESVRLHMYVAKPSRADASYEAAFVVTEATNVCGLALRSGQLLMQSGDNSSQYVFAPDRGHEALPPNNATCTPDFEYSLEVRPSVASAHLTVIALACPSNDSCGTLLLNERSCRNGETPFTPLRLGSIVTLRYAHRRGCGENSSQFVGFVVSVQVDASIEPPSTSSAASSRSVTARATATTRPLTRILISTPTTWTRGSSSSSAAAAATSSSTPAIATHEASADGTTSSLIGDTGACGAIDDGSSLKSSSTLRARSANGAVVTTSSICSDATTGRGFDLSDDEDALNVPAIAASVAAAAASALAVSVAAVLLCRYRRRRRSPHLKKMTSSADHRAPSSASANGEEIPMVNNDLYGVALDSRTTADE